LEKINKRGGTIVSKKNEKTIQVENQEKESPPHVIEPEENNSIIKEILGKKNGVVVNCNALRIREGANIKSRELYVLPVNSKVVIDLDNSTKTFYEVSYNTETNEITGFCLKEFIRVGD